MHSSLRLIFGFLAAIQNASRVLRAVTSRSRAKIVTATSNRHRRTEDNEKFFGINDENRRLLMDRKKALKRWRIYFEEISTVEFRHPAIPSAAPTHGSVQKIGGGDRNGSEEDRPGKDFYGSDNVAADLWKSKLWYPAEGPIREVTDQVKNADLKASIFTPLYCLRCVTRRKGQAFASNGKKAYEALSYGRSRN
ncbi:unnamed protein product [Heligmosomoides polygyrus]|uniref:Uncharacterized protein n=1 Tax=Heligmosomoides polygyrus TaxID=6339 RepID=A0A183GP66_HELPZ|nr:unnamed protein product [Heligmosomoides polygyrus]